jgi:phage gp29-like protein
MAGEIKDTDIVVKSDLAKELEEKNTKISSDIDNTQTAITNKKMEIVIAKN